MTRSSEGLKGRVLEANLADLNNDDEQASAQALPRECCSSGGARWPRRYRKIKLEIQEIQGRNCLADFHGMSLTRETAEGLFVFSIGCAAASGAGFGCGAQDISTRFSSLIYGGSSVFGVIAGASSQYLTGWLLEQNGRSVLLSRLGCMLSSKATEYLQETNAKVNVFLAKYSVLFELSDDGAWRKVVLRDEKIAKLVSEQLKLRWTPK